MTDPTPLPDDELVAAVLDGEATADERARFEADPAARARLAELAAVRDRVAEPVAVPAEARERAIAAALAAFDAPGAGTGAAAGPDAGGGAVVAPTFRGPDPGLRDELAARRAARSGSGGRYLAAAAAVIVVLFGVGVALRALNPPSVSTQASSDVAAPTTAASDGAVSGGSDREPSASEQATTTVARATPTAPATTVPVPAVDVEPFPADLVAVDLGAFESSRDLRDRLLGVVDARASTTEDQAVPSLPPSSPALARTDWTPCASYLDAVDAELGDLLAVGAATLDGRPVVVYAFRIDQVAHPAANGSIRIYAVDPTTCDTRSVQTTR